MLGEPAALYELSLKFSPAAINQYVDGIYAKRVSDDGEPYNSSFHFYKTQVVDAKFGDRRQPRRVDNRKLGKQPSPVSQSMCITRNKCDGNLLAGYGQYCGR